jgi:hypothetical protein
MESTRLRIITSPLGALGDELQILRRHGAMSVDEHERPLCHAVESQASNTSSGFGVTA